jgi:hypothetical protein
MASILERLHIYLEQGLQSFCQWETWSQDVAHWRPIALKVVNSFYTIFPANFFLTIRTSLTKLSVHKTIGIVLFFKSMSKYENRHSPCQDGGHWRSYWTSVLVPFYCFLLLASLFGLAPGIYGAHWPHTTIRSVVHTNLLWCFWYMHGIKLGQLWPQNDSFGVVLNLWIYCIACIYGTE